MKKPLTVHVLSSAKAAIAEALDWWRIHSEKARFGLDEELESALDVMVLSREFE